MENPHNEGGIHTEGERINPTTAEAAELERLRVAVSDPATATAEDIAALNHLEYGDPGFLGKPFFGMKGVTMGDVIGGTVAVVAVGAVGYGLYRLIAKPDEMADAAFTNGACDF
jgi:hypothetical protein